LEIVINCGGAYLSFNLSHKPVGIAWNIGKTAASCKPYFINETRLPYVRDEI